MTTSDNDLKFMTRAIDAAQLSTQRFKHGCLVVRNGNVLSVAVNRFRNMPGHAPVNSTSWHAEAGALRMVSEKASIGSTLYVARYGNNGSVALSRPCEQCWEYMERRGVKKVVYSTAPEHFAIERV